MSLSTSGPDPSSTGRDAHDLTGMGDYLDSLLEATENYVEAEKKSVELLAYEKIGKAVGELVGLVLAAVAVLFLLFFASVALALHLGTLLNSAALGFLLVGGIYLLLFIIVHFVARRTLRDATMLGVINSFRDEQD